MESRGGLIARSVGIVFVVCLIVYAAGAGLLTLATRSNSMLRQSLLEQLLDSSGLQAVLVNRTQAAGTLYNWWLMLAVIAFVMALVWICFTHILRPGYPKAESRARAAWYICFTIGLAAAAAVGYREFHMLGLAGAFDPGFLAAALIATSFGAILAYVLATALAVRPEMRSSALFASLMSRSRSRN